MVFVYFVKKNKKFLRQYHIVVLSYLCETWNLSPLVIQALGEHLKLRQQVIATATVYFKRFYAR